MGAQLGLPDALKRRGLTVEVVPGWETRSAGSFAPRGALCHWTAGPAKSTSRPSLSICTKGRADLPGPLCNVYLDRNGVAVVVAAGRANHAGNGSWRGVTGNSSLFGTECEAAGPNDFTKAQRWAYPRVNAAFCDLGGFGADMVAGHSEYATPKGRKQDINGYTMDDMRADVRSLLAGQQPTSPLQENPLMADQLTQTVLNQISVVVQQYADAAVSKPSIDWGPQGKISIKDQLVLSARDLAMINGKIDGLSSAVQQLAAGGGVDLAAVTEAARAGAAQIVDNLRVVAVQPNT